ncbi:class I SAM-dependent methyltransferase [Neisseria iguanae]|uniref:Ribosomal RNA small subunit methyltransferase J n=1 Tax=Neisseria iguanae TaxID=90242 RepID=A0A2P7TZI5_9NEIS|nr:class I SAM-dependent methyltransferase [Neisseria iguanae]PSJ80146.1 16S rRNA methyltransferase [Neisseria iguanae]
MTCIYIAESADKSARELAQAFGLTIICQLPVDGEYLYAGSDGISLCRAGEKGRVQVDFTGGAAQYRRTKGGGELIGKAVNHTARPTVWDGNGGLGRDSFVLASMGLNIHSFEQHPAVACLLHDGLNRALQHPDTAEIARRMTLHFGNTSILMPQTAQAIGHPDVVYLDPMYPQRQKSAAVKKEMAYFHGLVGTTQDESGLLNTARAVAKKRVVVKRPRLGEFLNGEKPAYQYSGKNTRFDLYLPDNPIHD